LSPGALCRRHWIAGHALAETYRQVAGRRVAGHDNRLVVVKVNTRTKVLLVDDEPFILTVSSRLLSEAGFDVCTCGIWTELTGLIMQEQPDLIMLDYNMPGLKGDDICSVLKRNILNPGMKVVLFSSEDEAFLRSVSISCGADGYIRKNQPPAQILADVTAALV
jgi:DNA-binding response OmpR family regulator